MNYEISSNKYFPSSFLFYYLYPCLLPILLPNCDGALGFSWHLFDNIILSLKWNDVCVAVCLRLSSLFSILACFIDPAWYGWGGFSSCRNFLVSSFLRSSYNKISIIIGLIQNWEGYKNAFVVDITLKFWSGEATSIQSHMKRVLHNDTTDT